MSQQLTLRGSNVGVRAIRGIWQLLLKHQRQLRLERQYRNSDVKLTENHVRLLERFDPEFRERHIKADFTGNLVAMDIFMVGNLKGNLSADHSWLPFQVRLREHLHLEDAGNRRARAERQGPSISSRNRAATSSRSLPTTARGRLDGHPFELFLQLEKIEHRRTLVRRPRIVELLHRTLLEEHFKVRGRVRFYESLGEMQEDLDTYMNVYNYKGRTKGNGRTPHIAFVEGIPIDSRE